MTVMFCTKKEDQLIHRDAVGPPPISAWWPNCPRANAFLERCGRDEC